MMPKKSMHPALRFISNMIPVAANANPGIASIQMPLNISFEAKKKKIKDRQMKQLPNT